MAAAALYPNIYVFSGGLSSFPNFKPTSNQTKIQNFLKIIFIMKHIRKTRFFFEKRKKKQDK